MRQESVGSDLTSSSQEGSSRAAEEPRAPGPSDLHRQHSPGRAGTPAGWAIAAARRPDRGREETGPAEKVPGMHLSPDEMNLLLKTVPLLFRCDWESDCGAVF